MACCLRGSLRPRVSTSAVSAPLAQASFREFRSPPTSPSLPLQMGIRTSDKRKHLSSLCPLVQRRQVGLSSLITRYDLIMTINNTSLCSSETLIYTVSPLLSIPAFLVTPDWPGPMQPGSTVSWMVNVPEEYSAHLNFSSVSWPQCHANRTEVKIQELDSSSVTSYSKDVQLPLAQNILRSFYLNVSNCENKKGKFALLSQISLQEKPGKFLELNYRFHLRQEHFEI